MIRNRIYRAIVILTMTITFAAFGRGQAGSPSFTLSIALPQPVTKAAAPIRLDLTVENETDQLLILGTIRNGGRRSGIILRNEKDEALPYRDDPSPGEIYKFSDFGLGVGPRKRATESVDLGRYFNLTTPGQYSLQIRRRDPLTHLQVLSNKVTLTIIP